MIKKVCLAFIFLLFCLLPLAAQEEEKPVNWFTTDFPALSAQWSFSLPFRKDLRNPSPSEDFIVAADFNELRISSGMKYQYDQFDFTNCVIYMPTFYNAFQAGFGFNWHFYRYFDVFTENDLTATARFRWKKGKVFSFENGIGILFKLTSIDALKEYKPIIHNISYQFELLLKWHVFRFTDFWFALNIQDYFDYPLAISNFYKFGLDLFVTPELVFGIDYTLKYADIFFSAVYLNESVLRFSFKVLL